MDKNTNQVLKKAFDIATMVSLALPWVIIGVIWAGPTAFPLLEGYIVGKLEAERLRSDVDKNTDFRIKWPKGELGRLPDDINQNRDIEAIKKRIEDLEKFFPRTFVSPEKD